MAHFPDMKKIEWILRVALFGEFLGHGYYALQIDPGFQVLLAGSTGLSTTSVVWLLPLIGLLDLAIAESALARPIPAVLVYAALWGFATALARPISGETEIWAFIERWPNCAVPLALLWVRGIPQNLRSWFF